MSSLQDFLDDLTRENETRAEQAVSGLVALGERALPALRELARSPETDHRWWAVRVLAQSPEAEADWLIPFLSDPAREVRQCAALGLALKPVEGAVDALVGALGDEDGMVSSLAVNALVRIGRPAVPALIDLAQHSLQDPSGRERARAGQSARIHAVRALAEIRDHRAIPLLMKVMEEDSVLLQHWAKEGLDRLGLDMVYIKPV